MFVNWIEIVNQFVENKWPKSNESSSEGNNKHKSTQKMHISSYKKNSPCGMWNSALGCLYPEVF